MDSRVRLHGELTAFLRQHCAVADERHLAQLGWMVAGLLFSQTVCSDGWKQALPLGHCLAASWQRRCRRWLSNLDPTLELVWLYGQRFCCEQLFRDQKSAIFQLERSGLRDPARSGLQWLQQSVITAGRALLAWLPIRLQALEPCIPSRDVRRRQKWP